MDGFDRHIARVADSLADGYVTPFLGAGANLCGRPRDYSWKPGDGYFPSGAELSLHLAHRSRFYFGDNAHDLMAVATYYEVMVGRHPLYKELRKIFDRDVAATSLHNFLARCPEVIRERDRDAPPPLIVTTNYDNVLEHALASRGEVFDVVAYVADGDGAGKFLHYPASGDAPILITSPSTYDRLAFERTTILKIHGTFDPMSADRDSYVISENQYVDYLTTDSWEAIPAAVTARLKETHFLFLGYAMRDWNLMVVLRRLGLVPPKFRSWAIQLHQTELDERRWTRLEIESFDVDLAEYVDALAVELGLD